MDRSALLKHMLPVAHFVDPLVFPHGSPASTAECCGRPVSYGRYGEGTLMSCTTPHTD